MQQQKGRVDHVCFIYKKENFSSAMKQLGDALGITDWDGPKELPYFGILQAQSLESGIEILSPLAEEGDFAQHLRTKGEGFFALIFGVENIETVVKSASEKGAAPRLGADGNPLLIDALHIDNGRPAHDSWSDKLSVYKEVPLNPVCGLNIYFGQIEPRTESS